MSRITNTGPLVGTKVVEIAGIGLPACSAPFFMPARRVKGRLLTAR